MSDDVKQGDDSELERVRDGFRIRLRYGKGLRGRFVIRLRDEAVAERRATRLRELADVLTRAELSAEARVILRKGAAVESERDFAEVVKVAETLCAPRLAPRKLTSPSITVRQLGEQWTDGTLHRRFRDQVPLKRTRQDDVSRLQNYVYPVIGSRQVASVTLDDGEQIMRLLPETLASLTRRGIAGLLVRLMKLAVYPLRIIAASPFPAGFLPQKGPRKALAHLYPDEDRRLLACADVPLSFRMLWGFLTREGMRESEAMTLTWGDVDLERGAVRLDKNKTDDPRAWALARGTAAALKAYRDRRPRKPEPTELVFLDPQGLAHTKFGAAQLLRGHLRAVGLHVERPELFKTTDERKQIRVHDLRGTFVTVALANGRSESWIGDRTGHRSSAMIARYKRTSRTFAELALGDLVPLDEAIPELRSVVADGEGGPGVGQAPLGSMGQESQIELKSTGTESVEARRPQRDAHGY